MLSLPYGLSRTIRLAQAFVALDPGKSETLALQFQRHAESTPDKVFLIFEDRSYTYGAANELINRHAYAYKVLGVDSGDVVALVMENRPEYLFHVLALHKIGAVSSLINTHGTGDVLAHALRICEPKHVVVGSEVWSHVSDVLHALPQLEGRVDVDVDPDEAIVVPVPVFQERLVEASSQNPPETASHRLSDKAALIYTSGTTGLPKAANISHMRLFRAGRVWGGAAFRYQQHDRLYNCLPLYHSNGLMLGAGSAITAGVTMVLARKFSASRFWEDIRRHGCTQFIYIGELCRYLMNRPPSPTDTDHGIRAVSGNGLRPDIWEDFQRRFGIPRIAEFYGATEGNCITINVRGRVGSVGPIMPGMVLARWNPETEEFIRDGQGFLVKAKRGESGILLGKERKAMEFEGYQDRKATDAKRVRDAFEPGDSYFNTGDLLRMDSSFHLYFVDRLGDTFRWKGENVATFEVQEQLAKWEPLAEVNVYGVEVPGADGRAGMAALVLASGADFDAQGFGAFVDEALPSYARPLFLRLQSELATTGTFKIKKADLQKQGFDPSLCEDQVYFRNPETGAYAPVDTEVHRAIVEGRFRL